MRKIVMIGPRKSEIADVAIPIINSGQLLVKVMYTGMCHSEWYPWSTAFAGQAFGHEPVGVVVEVGKDVKGFKVGDRVSGLGGGYQEYIAMDALGAVIVPDNVSDEDAAMTEAFACMISAVDRFPLDVVGDTVAVVGAGFMGLGAISLLKLKGFTNIVAVDIRKEARENALKYGAKEAYSPEELSKNYKLTWSNFGSDNLSRDGEKIDIFNIGFRKVLEFTGTESGLRLAGDMVSAHGLLGIGGYHNDAERTIDFKLWNVKAFTIENCHERRYDHHVLLCKRALELLSSGDWKFTGLATHIYSMDEFDKANEEMEQRPKGYIKALVRCN